MKQLNCQRCGKEITEAERRSSGKLADFIDGVCPHCFDSLLLYDKPGRYPEDKPEDGWRIFNNISDYQKIFDQVRVCYNMMELPKQFPCAAFLHIGCEMDSTGAWFIHVSVKLRSFSMEI